MARTAHDPSTRFLRGRIRAFFRELPAALAGEEEGVHQMRVAGRRLRLALVLCARRPEGRRIRRARRVLRAAVRAAAGCRDLDVGLRIFDARVAAAGDEPGVAEVRRRLRAARRRARARMTEAILDLDLAQLRRDLRRVLAQGGGAGPPVASRLREARDATGAALLARLEGLGTEFDPEALHGVRRGVRRLRYVAEATVELTAEASEAPKRLKGLQEQLGRIHDTAVLAAWLGREAARAERRGRATGAAAARRWETACLDAAREHHREYLARDPVGTLKQALVLIGPGGAGAWEAGA